MSKRGTPLARRRFSPLAQISVGVILFVVAFHHALSPEVFLDRRDAFSLYLPLRTFLADQLRLGRIPTWFDHDGMGGSFIGGSTSGLFHPTTLLYLLLSPAQGLKWQTLLSYPTAALGAGLLARELGARLAGQWLAGLGYALSGYLLSVSDNGPYAIGPAMLPWALWAAERLSREPTPRRVVALALTLALTLWSGDAQQFVIQAELVPLVLLVGGRTGAWVRWRAWLAAMALLTLLTAPLLLPLWVVAQETGRSAGLVPGALEWPFEPVRLFELLYGQPYPPSYLSTETPIASHFLGRHLGGVWAVSEHLGTTVVVLALAGVLSRPNRRARWLYGSLALVGMLLASGTWGHIYPWASQLIPMWRSFRYPEKVMPIAILGWCVLAGLGTHRLGHRDRRLIGAALGIAVVTGLLLFGSWGDLGGLLTRLDIRHEIPDADLVATIAGWARTQLVAGLGSLALLGVLIAWRSRGAGWGAVALVFLQALPLAGWAVHVESTQVLSRRSPFADVLQAKLAGSSERFCWDVQQLQFDEDPQGVDVAVTGKLRTLAPDLGSLLGVGTSNHGTPVIPASLNQVCVRGSGCASPCSRLEAARLGVIDGERFDAIHAERGLTELVRDPASGTVLFLDPLARPYASLPAVHFLPTAEAAKADLARPDRRPAEEVVQVGTEADQPAPGGSISVRRPRPDRIEAQVTVSGPGLAVFAENCSSGWRATLDGVPTSLSKADLVLCSVAVREGNHQIVLEYEPPGWPWLVPLWAFGLLLSAGILWKAPTWGSTQVFGLPRDYARPT